MMKYEKLTDSEELVMKCVWDCTEQVSLPNIVKMVNDRYGKEWKPQTVSTFLARLVRKDYVKLHRVGRLFYYEILITEDAYKSQILKKHINFWNASDVTAFACDLCSKDTLNKNDIKKMRDKLNELD